MDKEHTKYNKPIVSELHLKNKFFNKGEKAKPE